VQKSGIEGQLVLVNNAGVNLDQNGEYGVENVKKTMEVNYWGTLNVSLPLFSNLKLARSLPSTANPAKITTILTA
jgi:carbonyl reductase 1